MSPLESSKELKIMSIKGKKFLEFIKKFQSHIYIIVSRKDKTQRLKLRPTCDEKLTSRTIGKINYQVGFDRVKWIDKNEKI